MKHPFTHGDPSPVAARSQTVRCVLAIDTQEFGRGERTMADLQEIDRLIEHSSLGAEAAKSLRDRTPTDAVRPILDRADSLDHDPFTVGIEILPYELIGVLTDHHGVVCGRRRWSLPSMAVDTVVEHVAKVAKDLTVTSLGVDLPHRSIGIGLQIGGPVDTRTGTVISYSNHPTDPTTRKPHTGYRWPRVKLAELVEKATGCRTVLENDANAYAVYEHMFGVGREVGSSAVIIIHDGVGCGMIVDGKLLPGPLEFGHMVVWPDGRECDCGNRGDIESQAGRRAMRAVVRELTQTSTDLEWEAAVKLAQGEGDQADTALRAFELAGESIARGIATLLTLHGLPRVVIYGPEVLVESGRGNRVADAFMAAADTFSDYAFHAVPRCELVARPMRPTDGAHGVALIALQRLFSVRLTSNSPKWSASNDLDSPSPRRETPSDRAGYRS